MGKVVSDRYGGIAAKVEEIYLDRLRKMSGEARLEVAAGLGEAVKELAIAGIRHDHPDISDDELKAELHKRTNG